MDEPRTDNIRGERSSRFKAALLTARDAWGAERVTADPSRGIIVVELSPEGAGRFMVITPPPATTDTMLTTFSDVNPLLSASHPSERD